MRRFSGYGPSIIVLITAAIVLFAGPAAVRQLTYEQTRANIQQARHRLESTDVLAQVNQATRDIATMVEPSVVHVSAQYVERDALTGSGKLGLSSGSGWLYDDQGHVVTNHHVIQNAQRIEVQLYDGGLREATLVGSDPTTDIAVIQIAAERLHPASLADVNDAVNQGDMVFAFGSPFDFRFSMSSGVVSGKGRSVGVIRDENGRRAGYENFIQVDAAINPGNSGGPLTDYRGKVIGMNTAIATGRSRGGPSLEEGQFAGIGLAIPIDMIIPAVTQIIERGFVEKSFMGVEVGDINATIAQRSQFSGNGAVLGIVHPDGPAYRAGVRSDDIVTSVNGRDITSGQQLRSIVSSMRPGDTAQLTLWRYDRSAETGQTMHISVPLEKLDSLRAQGRLDPHQQSHDSIIPLGIQRMLTSTPADAKAAGVEYRPGVLLAEITPNSRLSRRVENGSIVISVMDEPVRNVAEFLAALAEVDLSPPRMDSPPHGPMVTIVRPNGDVVNVQMFASE